MPIVSASGKNIIGRCALLASGIWAIARISARILTLISPMRLRIVILSRVLSIVLRIILRNIMFKIGVILFVKT